jgi:hypothetical protein
MPYPLAAVSHRNILVDTSATPPVPNPIMLLRLDGVDDSTTIVDELGGSFQVSGSCKLDDTQKKFGTVSALFAGKTSYIYGTTTAPGTGDFAWGLWMRPTNMESDGDNARSGIIGTNFQWNDNAGVSLDMNINGTLFLYPGYNGGYNPLATTTEAVSINTWNYVALVRNSGVFNIYVNGVKGPDWENSWNLSNTTINIGRGMALGGYGGFNGYIDEFAYYNYARYTSSFSNPTSPIVLS